MQEPAITPELIASHGLKPDEYQRILDIIGREPSFTELGIFSAMWNEHCSYKSSKKWLRTLPKTKPTTTPSSNVKNRYLTESPTISIHPTKHLALFPNPADEPYHPESPPIAGQHLSGFLPSPGDGYKTG